MQPSWWPVLAALAPLADTCESPDIAPPRKIVEAARAPEAPAQVQDAPPAPDRARARPLLRGCPRLTLPQRFAGQLAGLAWVAFTDGTADLTTAAPGAAPTGPEPLPTLTVVRAGGTLQFADPKRTVHAADAKGRASVTLAFPLPDPTADTVVFVTTACLPNAEARLRSWTYTPMSPIAATFDEHKARIDAHIAASQRPGDRNAWERRGGVPPAGLGVFATTIPWCPTLLTVNVDLATRLAHDFLSAIVCADADGKYTDVLAPQRGRLLRWVGVADLDGDGVEEVAVHTRTFDRAGKLPRTSTDELLVAGDGAFTRHVLGHIVHGS